MHINIQNDVALTRFIGLLISLMFLAGCAKNWYIGEWTVTDVQFPAVSAMSNEAAVEWFGSKAIYTESLFSFREKRCQSPQFELESLPQSEFYAAYRASFRQLNIDGDSVSLMRISCSGDSVFPGSTLVRVTDNIVYTPWDGAFFRFERSAP